MGNIEDEADVLVIGGRIAGAALAIHLGASGKRVVVWEKEKEPLPLPVSSPAIFASSMAFLEDLGLREEDYARGTPKLNKFILSVRGAYRTENFFPPLRGRDYVYAVDRARFDDALWSKLKHSPGVTARSGVRAVELLRDGSRVMGARGVTDSGDTVEIKARCVAGADGMVSDVAGMLGVQAPVWKSRTPFFVAYSYWRNIKPFPGHRDFVHFATPMAGLLLMVMDSADGSTCAVVIGRSDLLDRRNGDAEPIYRELLASSDEIGKRFEGGERVGAVRLLRRVHAYYRRSSGQGWALVGDACSFTHPYAAQGIYNALAGAKQLAAALEAALMPGAEWSGALKSYDDFIVNELGALSRTTERRIAMELYRNWPAWIVKKVFRRLHEDPVFKERFASWHLRTVPVSKLLTPDLIAGVALRNIRRAFSAART